MMKKLPLTDKQSDEIIKERMEKRFERDYELSKNKVLFPFGHSGKFSIKNGPFSIKK